MRKQLTLVSLFAPLLMVVVTSGYAQKKNSASPFFFIQLTDPQFGFYESNAGFSKETELYEKAVSEINRLQPDFVVITGDMVHNKDIRSQVDECKRITARINSDIPVYFSPGNHDIGQKPEQKDIDLFNSDYGSDRFSFKHRKCLFVGLNSVVIKSSTAVFENEQFEWLKKELTTGKRVRHKIIFTHYPFFIRDFDEPETYSNIAPDLRKKYLELFKENNVDAVFAGHLHNNASASYGKMKMITTSAIGKPLAKIPSGFRIVIICPDRIEDNYYSLDETPETVILRGR